MDAAEMVEGEIARHGEEPRIEAARWIVSANFLRHAKPGLLKEVFSFGGFADEAQEIAIEAVLITRDQRGERVEVPAPQLHDVCVKHHRRLPDVNCGAHHIPGTGRPLKRIQGGERVAPIGDGGSAHENPHPVKAG